MLSARLLCMLYAVASAAGAPAAAWAQTVTIAPEQGEHLREIRCNEDAQTTLDQRLRLTREQCLMLGRETSVLPRHTVRDRRQSTFGAMTTATRIGQVVPRSVELSPLPARVTEAFPDLSRYRYFVSGDDIAIVDPGDDIVVAIIDVHVRPWPEQGALPSTRPSQ